MILPICNHDAPFPTRYTYGQPVQGKAQIKVCRELFSQAHCESNENEICEQFTVQVRTTGLLRGVVGRPPPRDLMPLINRTDSIFTVWLVGCES